MSLERTRRLATLGLVAGALSSTACAEGGSVEGGSAVRELALSPQVPAPMQGEQTEVRLAASATQHLAVWIDRQAIVCARVRFGELVDDRPMVIHRGNGVTVPEGAGGLAVASNGADFIVLWSERHLVGGDLDVRFARVSAAGVVLDPGGRALAESAANERGPAVLWTDYGWITAYRSDADVQMVRLDPNGRRWESMIYTISTLGDGDAAPAIAPTEHGALIAFREANQVLIARTDFAGGADRLGAVAELYPQAQLRGLALSRLGDGYLLGMAERTGIAGVTRVVRLNADGLPLDAQPMQIADQGDRAPTIAWNGQLGLIAVEAGKGIEVIPVLSRGLGFGGRFTVEGTAPYLSALGGDSLLGYVRHDGGALGANTYFARVAGDGSPLAGSRRLLSLGHDLQQRPAIAMGNYGALVAWTDSLNADHSGMDVRYAQLSLAGKVQRTGTLGSALDDFAPAVATDGSKYFVAWGDGEGAVRAALIDEIGDVRRTSRLPFGASTVAAAWNGKVYLVSTPGLALARFDSAGVPLDAQLSPLFPEVDSLRMADEIALVGAEDGFLAAYHWRNGFDFIGVARIGPNASIAGLPAAIDFGRSPALAWDGDRHLLGYWDEEGRLTTQRLLPNAHWTEAPARLPLTGHGLALAPAAGGGVLVSFQDALGVLRVGELDAGRFTALPRLVTTGAAPALATFEARVGLAFEVVGLDDAPAVHARLLLP